MMSARDVALAMLDLRFGTRVSRTRRGLAPFQQEACDRLLDILATRRGAIHADSVGLGKTHVARAIVEDALSTGQRVLVCGPAQLAHHWKRHLHGLEGWRWMSHTRMSRQNPTAHASFDLIVVDEAHAFRNCRSRRHANLKSLCRDARVLLVTATPVNNSLRDFLCLLRLFAGDDSFVDAGVPDLTAAFHACDGHAARRIAEQVMVRRTREDIERSATTHSRLHLRFPRCAPMQLLHYDLDAGYPQLSCVLRQIQALEFPAHALSRAAAPDLMRLTLLKRLESGTAAFAASIDRYRSLLNHFIRAAQLGYFFDPARDRGLYARVQDAVQLPFEALSLSPWPHAADRDTSVERAAHEAALLDSIATHTQIRDCDPKLAALRDLLTERFSGQAVLVFSEFRETAEHIWRALAPAGGVALIHGADARLGFGRASRRAIIERFAPHANHARAPARHQRVQTLIATDVLAEGLNLQDAAAVVSYDVPWNPVRLAQRIGRIDRLGSPHEQVFAIAFRPESRLDEYLGLMRRVKAKLRTIRTVGGDAPRFRSRRMPTRVLSDMSLLEQLRTERARHITPAKANGLAAATYEAGFDGALCCVTTGTSTMLVLLRPDGREQLGGPEIDRLLLDLLRDDRSALPRPTDPAAVRHYCAAAEAGIRRRMDRATDTRRQDAERVREWLRTLPLGATQEDLYEAGVDLHAGEGLRHDQSSCVNIRALIVLSSGMGT